MNKENEMLMEQLEKELEESGFLDEDRQVVCFHCDDRLKKIYIGSYVEGDCLPACLDCFERFFNGECFK